MKFDFDDILLTPEVFSSINSRSEIDPYDSSAMLPIMTAPMDTVVNVENYDKFINNRINVVLPRGIDVDVPYSYLSVRWYSYGLEEFKELFLDASPHTGKKTYALIDIANGHMEKVYEYAKKAKEKYGNKLALMVGNIANPKIIPHLDKIGVDYVRCGIGGGSACLTSVQTGVGYPMASLISECSNIKKSNNLQIKIIADGGFRKFADINKALALGADYVMLGSMLNKAYESAGELVVQNSFMPVYEKFDIENFKKIYNDDSPELILKLTTVYKQYRGMSTKEVQKDWGKTELKTAEGIVKYNKVEYTLAGFVENLEDYLRSAMSYVGARTLNEFRFTDFEQITPASFKRFEK